MAASLGHEDTLLLYLSLGLVLLVARILGEMSRMVGQPAVMGELLAGVLLGKTCFGTLAPNAFYEMFQSQSSGTALLGSTSIFVTMYMLVAGMEMDLKSAAREKKATAFVGLLAVITPFVIGFLLAYYAPTYMGNTNALDVKNYALFAGTAMSITALPVIAKTLRDLKLFKTRMGVIVVSSAVVDDVVGWSLFAVVLAVASESTSGGGNGLGVIGGVCLSFVFVLLMFTVVTWAVNKILPFIQAHFSYPAGELGFVCLLTFASCSFALWVGLHNTLGAFLAGAAIGNSKHFRHEMREHLDNFVTFMLSPIFFGSVCINCNFVKDFDYKCVLLVLLGSCAGKVIGSILGSKLASLSWTDAAAIAVCMNARGAMELILANVALESKIIDGKMFVALVFMAIVTSILPGPLLRRVLRQQKTKLLSEYVHSRGFVQLSAASLPEIICSLCELMGQQEYSRLVMEYGTLVRHEAVLHHLKGAAVMRAEVPGLKRITAAFAVSSGTLGVCGLPTKYFMLLLVPDTRKNSDRGLWQEAKMLFTSQKFCKELSDVSNRTELLALIQMERYRGGFEEGSTSSEEMSIQEAASNSTCEIDEMKCQTELEKCNFERFVEQGYDPIDARQLSSNIISKSQCKNSDDVVISISIDKIEGQFDGLTCVVPDVTLPDEGKLKPFHPEHQKVLEIKKGVAASLSL